MVKALHTTLVILGVVWLIYDIYALERKSNHETDFYFDDVESGFNKSIFQNSATHNKGRLIPQSAWSKEIKYTDEKERNNIHKPTSPDSSLSDISAWDMKTLLANLLPLLQSLNKNMSINKHKANPDENAFEMKDNIRRNQSVNIPEKNQHEPLKTSLLQTGPIERNSTENISEPSSSSIYISKVFENSPIGGFHSSKPDRDNGQTSDDAVMQQTEKQFPDAILGNNQEDIPKRAIHNQFENNKSPNEINSDEKIFGKIPLKETTPLTYAKSDQESVTFHFDESIYKNPEYIKISSFPKEAIPAHTDKRLMPSFKNISKITSDNSTNVQNLTKQLINQPSNENLVTKYSSNLEVHQGNLSSKENGNVKFNRSTNDDILKNSEIYQSPNENIEAKNSSNLEAYNENPSSNEEYLNGQTEVYPELNSAETNLPQNSSSETEMFSNIQKVMSTVSGEDTDSESLLLGKDSNSQNQLDTENYDSLANDPMSIQQEDDSYEDYGSGEDTDSDDDSDYEDYSNEHDSYDTDEDIKTSDFEQNETQNATQAPESVSALFTNSSFDLPPYSKNETVNAAFKNPPGKFNSILEYIYSVSNNPFFLSLRKQNKQTS